MNAADVLAEYIRETTQVLEAQLRTLQREACELQEYRDNLEALNSTEQSTFATSFENELMHDISQSTANDTDLFFGNAL